MATCGSDFSGVPTPNSSTQLQQRVAELEHAVARLRRAEDTLAETARRLSTLLSNLPGLAYRCANDPQWTMEFLSDGCLELTGYRPEDLQGNRRVAYADLIHPDDRAQVWRDVQDALARNEPFRIEYRIRTSAGQQKWVWEQGRGVLADDGSLVALEGFITDITPYKRAEEQLRSARQELEAQVMVRTSELTQINALLRQRVDECRRAEAATEARSRLLQQALDVYEREHRLLAYEIHDGLAQQIAAVLYLLEAIGRQVAEGEKPAVDMLHTCIEQLRRAVVETRRLIRGLSPVVGEKVTLAEALRELVDEARSGGPQVEFIAEVQFERLAAPLESAVFRIVQESLTNALRHSGSARIFVRLVQQAEKLVVEVRDWGCGFDPNCVTPDHFGLEGIRKRAEVFGGRAVIQTAPSHGTHIVVELPIVEG